VHVAATARCDPAEITRCRGGVYECRGLPFPDHSRNYNFIKMAKGVAKALVKRQSCRNGKISSVYRLWRRFHNICDVCGAAASDTTVTALAETRVWLAVLSSGRTRLR